MSITGLSSYRDYIRAYVTPQDVKTIGPDVLRHRVLLTYEAEAQDLDSDAILRDIFNTVDVP